MDKLKKESIEIEIQEDLSGLTDFKVEVKTDKTLAELKKEFEEKYGFICGMKQHPIPEQVVPCASCGERWRLIEEAFTNK